MRVDTGRLRVVAAHAAPSTELPLSEPPSVESATSDRGRDRDGDRDTELEADVGLGADGFDSPGPYIRAQRKRKGMSLDQLAVATKIPRAQLVLLEADRYAELPGMVFAKGFLRCCARSLDLDPDTVLGLLYERERAQLHARRREPAERKSAARPVRPGAVRAKRQPSSWLAQVQGRIAAWVTQLPSARIALWIVVALLVALIVFIAFTLASSQAQSLMIQS